MKVIPCVAVGLSALVFSVSTHGSEDFDIFDLPLETLMNITAKGVASLTDTQRRHVPSSITYITHKDIKRSGARSLDDLLEIYVPGFQVWLKTNGNPMGMRGIISDRNTKMLLLLNGRLMNEHTALGVVSERYLSMLGDIKSIEVIRGPGSQVYGSGALAGVINIRTFDGENFTGQQVTVKAGAIEKFYSVQYQAGNTLESGAHVFFYYGADRYSGANNQDAPMSFSTDFTNTVTNDSVNAYEPVPFAVPKYKEAYPNTIRQKLHLDYRHSDFNTWMRFTQGGQSRDLSLGTYASNDPASALDEGIGYQQLTLNSEYQPKLNQSWQLDTRISYDLFDVEFGNRHYREDELMARILGHWQTDRHKASTGFEYSKEFFGKKSLNDSDSPASISTSLTNLNSGEWQTYMASWLADYQWHINDKWTVFTGLRSDKHSYTQWMHSPRLAFVFTPTDQDQFKLLLNQSVRRADDDNLREYYLISGNSSGHTETLNALEISWDHQWSAKNRNQVSLFYNDYDLVGWDSSAQEINPLGNLKFLGLEAESHLHWQNHHLSLLYTYVKEQDFSLENPNTNQFISASVYGHGSDLANWAKQTIKLNYQYQWNSHWSGFSSLRAFMLLDGTAAMTEYNFQEHNDTLTSLPRTNGDDRAFKDRIFWDISARYRRASLEVGLHAYNVLGWFDHDLNRRNVFGRSGQYRLEAPSISASVQYKF